MAHKNTYEGKNGNGQEHTKKDQKSKWQWQQGT